MTETARARIQRALLVFCAYLAIAFLFHGAGHNISRDLHGGGDGYTAGLPSKVFSAQLSPWNPYVQLGQYTFANTQFQPFYPPGLIVLGLFPNTLGYNLFILGHYAMAGFFFYLFARNLKLSRYAAFTGGLVFMCCGFLIAHKGHQSMMSTAVWLPLMLLFADRFAVSNRFRDAALGGLSLAMSILGGFPQVTVYALMVVVPYLVFRCMFQTDRRRFVRVKSAALGLLIFTCFGFLLGSLQLFAVAEALPHITREKISFAMFREDSLLPSFALIFLIPNLLSDARTYLPHLNVVEMYGYVGLAPLALALFAFLWLRRTVPDVWFWTVVALTSGVLALGLPPVQRVLYHVPVYNLFRAAARHLYEVNFAIAALAAYGADRLVNSDGPVSGRTARAVRWTCFILGLLFICVFTGLQVLRHAGLFHLNLSHRTLVYPLVFFVLTAGLLLAIVRIRSKGILMTALSIVLCVDTWSVYRTVYVNPDTTDLYDAGRRAETAYLNAQEFDRTHYRIYPVDQSLVQTYPLLNMMYGISVVNDYTPMWLKRYQRFASFSSNGAAPDLVEQHKLASILGIQYLLAREPATIGRIRIVSKHLNIFVAKLPALNDTLSLQSPDGQAMAIVHFPVSLRASTNYKIQFRARITGELQTPLFVDLHPATPGGAFYDYPEQDRILWRLGRRFARYTLLINSGPSAPEKGMMRMFTQSRNAIELRNVSIEEVQSLPVIPAYTEVARTPEGISIFKNPKALPRFRFVTELVPAKDLEEAWEILLGDESGDPASHAVVEGLTDRTVVSPGRIVQEHTSNNFLQWQVETGPRSFLVVGDTWFPGWRAKVDGRQTDIHIVNGFLRGIFIDGPGTHTVEMRFWPSSLTYGIFVTLSGIVLLIGSFVLPWRRKPAITAALCEM